MSNLRLDSWKTIADHMNRGVRTVQRWHLDHGLPIYRAGGNKGSVYAYAHELEHWLAGGAAGDRNADGLDPLIAEQKRRSAEAERLASELWEVRSEENLEIMLKLYRSAMDQYPHNVAGIAGLANSLMFGGLIEVVDLDLAYPSIKAAVNKAIQKDPRHLKVQAAVAWANLLYERKWRHAETKFDDVLRANPAFGSALFGKALLHLAGGDLAEATRFAWASWSAEPMGACQAGLASICMVYAGDVDGAATLVKQVEMAGASCGMLSIARAMVAIQTMHPQDAMALVQSLLERHASSSVLRGLLGYASAAAGEAERAEQMLESLRSKDSLPGSWYAKALVMSGLGRIREAVDTLKERENVLSLWRMGYRTDRLLAPLSDHAEFQELMVAYAPENSQASRRAGQAA